MNWLGQNWKTTLAGLCAFLMAVPGFVAALQSWANGQSVNWRQVFVSLAITAISAGLAMAKDGTTAAEVDQATNVANVEAQLPKK